MLGGARTGGDVEPIGKPGTRRSVWKMTYYQYFSSGNSAEEFPLLFSSRVSTTAFEFPVETRQQISSGNSTAEYPLKKCLLRDSYALLQGSEIVYKFE